MTLHLLGKKSWNVYNPENIARVRRDEATARVKRAESERQQHFHEANARLALLRGRDPLEQSSGADNVDSAETAVYPHDSVRCQRTRRRLDGEDDTDRDIRLARICRDESGRQGIKLADAESRHSRSTPAPAWYMAAPADHSNSTDPGRDVWGNEDAGRRARDQRRLNADDPLAAIKKGVAQLRRADEHRKAWREQRERDLAGVAPLADLDLDAPSATAKEGGTDKASQKKERHGHRHHRHHHRHRHRHHRHHSRSASPQPEKEHLSSRKGERRKEQLR